MKPGCSRSIFRPFYLTISGTLKLRPRCFFFLREVLVQQVDKPRDKRTCIKNNDVHVDVQKRAHIHMLYKRCLRGAKLEKKTTSNTMYEDYRCTRAPEPYRVSQFSFSHMLHDFRNLASPTHAFFNMNFACSNERNVI